jgi:protein-S-isoprenylcysteine O-methyltransferase Ste14
MNSTETNLEALVKVQRMRKLVLLGLLLGCGLVLLTGHSAWPPGTPQHEGIETVGLIFILVAIVGRTWCSLYIGGRKSRRLIDTGPYSVTRNPLYVFSAIGAVGAGAQTGSAVLALVGGLIAYSVFSVVVQKEEMALRQTFGAPYLDYMAQVPRFLPQFWLWRGERNLQIVPRRSVITLLDSLFFLLAIPVAEGFKYLHLHGYVPTLFRLP